MGRAEPAVGAGTVLLSEDFSKPAQWTPRFGDRAAAAAPVRVLSMVGEKKMPVKAVCSLSSLALLAQAHNPQGVPQRFELMIAADLVLPLLQRIV